MTEPQPATTKTNSSGRWIWISIGVVLAVAAGAYLVWASIVAGGLENRLRAFGFEVLTSQSTRDARIVLGVDRSAPPTEQLVVAFTDLVPANYSAKQTGIVSFSVKNMDGKMLTLKGVTPIQRYGLLPPYVQVSRLQLETPFAPQGLENPSVRIEGSGIEDRSLQYAIEFRITMDRKPTPAATK